MSSKPSVRFLSSQLDHCLARDRESLRRQLENIRKRSAEAKPVDRSLAKLTDELALSCAQVERRASLVPSIEYPSELPISARQEDIRQAIAGHQVVVIAGETGSGKTTQIPKLCLELGRGVRGMIGHTQPRRIAARTVAQRLAEELQSPLGELVGYQVRFADQSGDNTLIKLMTDGILLAEVGNDRLLRQYDTLIIDEAHERSLNIDFLLGYIKKILPQRPDLKVVITSATIDVERFSKHFNNAPVIEVSGRSYPVEILYRPPLEADDDLASPIVAAVEELRQRPHKGDILVFLSGEREIRETSTALRRANFPDLEVMPLYARLSLAEQVRIFKPHRGQRVVLATNVAETSLTVPGIRYVIDSGLARLSRYSYRTKVQRLPVEPISQASAQQRAGRCGRLADGVCIRLYSEEDYNNRTPYTDPEIVRTNLAAVILRMLDMRIGEIGNFPFVEPPERQLINDGLQVLTELKAVTGRGQLTETGRALGKLPTDPRLGKMLLMAGTLGALTEVLAIVSALSIQDPRERPADKRQKADEKHRQWRDPDSDFVSLLSLWQELERQRQNLTRKKFSQFCHANFISYLRAREWRDLFHQLHMACRQIGLRENRQPASYDAIHQSLLSGLLSHIGVREDNRDFLGIRNRKFLIFPGSGLHQKPPKWVVAAELVETSRLYARQVARIEPEWVPPLAEHMLRRTHSEPYYDRQRGQVMAYEKQNLYGLTVVDRLRVPYAHIDPVVSRQVFIQGALVEGRYRGKGKFATHNRHVLAELEELQNRYRRSDLSVDDVELYRFYDERIPPSIVGLKDFEAWRKGVEADNPRLLYLDRALLLARVQLGGAAEQFPKAIHWQGVKYSLSYRFEPGHVEDGVTVTIPIPLLNRAPSYRFEWLVPGLLRDKCIALVKSLPKHVRKQFVPAPDYVDKALVAMEVDNTSLCAALGRQLQRHTGVNIAADLWSEQSLENFYRITYCLVDEKGHRIAIGKDLDALKLNFREVLQESIEEAVADNLELQDITRWSFGKLKPSQHIKKGKLELEVYPALVDEGDRVSLRMLDNADDAGRCSLKGMVRLLLLQHPDAAKYLRRQLLKKKELALVAGGFTAVDDLRDDLIASAYKCACLPDAVLPRQEADFQRCLEKGRGRIVSEAQKLEALVLGLLEPLAQVRRYQHRYAQSYPEANRDIGAQLGFLLRPGFLFETDLYWLQQYPRYVRALVIRLEKLPSQVEKDRVFSIEVEPFIAGWRKIIDRPGGSPRDMDAELEKYRFLIEEFRVSIFAQGLKTVKPVSTQRLRKALETLESSLSGTGS